MSTVTLGETDNAHLEVEGLQVRIPDRGGDRIIVGGIDFAVARGEAVAVVGESGSGKSLTARALINLLPPNLEARGNIRLEGRSLLECSSKEWRGIRGREIGMVPQDPFTMLNPLQRCGDQVMAGYEHSGRSLRREALRTEITRRLAEVGISDPGVARLYPFELSGGMRQRVGIAAALASDPEFLLADEPSTALDVTTQHEILELLGSLRSSRAMSLILITHDLRVAFSVCDRAYVLYAGSVLESGPARQMDAEPNHPYTLGLLLAEPPVDHRAAELSSMPGRVPTFDEVAGQCPFAPRCRWVEDSCRSGRPELVEAGPGRASRCARLPEISSEMRAARAAGREAAGAEEPTTTPGKAGPLLLVEGAGKVFRSRNRQFTALREVSLEVGRAERVGVVGESGSGKTTLGRCIAGLTPLSAGKVSIDGVELGTHKLGGDEQRRLRSSVQFVFQDPYGTLNPALSVGTTLGEAAALGAASGIDPSTPGELLEMVGLSAKYARRRPAQLSGGERQRIAIARALAVKPALLICDEPVSALDVSVQAQVLQVLIDLHTELDIAYLFITHDLGVVRQIADRIYVMLQGEIVEEGEVGKVLDDPKHPYTKNLIASIPG